MRQIMALFLGLSLSGTAQGQNLTDAQANQMFAADVVVLGELHDNAAHHIGQAGLLSMIKPKVVVFEMLTPRMADVVNAQDRMDMARLGEVLGWEAAGWPDFPIYLPVFEALDQASVVGAAAPREIVRRAFNEGAAAVFGADADRFGLEKPLPSVQKETRLALQFEAHCAAMPLELMDGMVEAQRLRDAQFAKATLKALESHGAPVAVITGNGHARRDWAVPFAIAQAAPHVTVYSVGFLEAPAAADDPRFHATIVTAPAQRDDPCAKFSN